MPTAKEYAARMAESPWKVRVIKQRRGRPPYCVRRFTSIALAERWLSNLRDRTGTYRISTLENPDGALVVLSPRLQAALGKFSDEIQFARMLAEINAVGLTVEQEA